MSEQYRYYISYSFYNPETMSVPGFGAIELSRSDIIRDGHSVLSIMDKIKETSPVLLKDAVVVVLNWQRFEED